MNNKSINYLGYSSLFSTNCVEKNIIKEEDFVEVKIYYSCTIDKFPTKEDFILIINSLNDRDKFHLSILKDKKVIENFASSKNDENDFEDYVETLKNNDLKAKDEIEVKFTIVKNTKENILSIYFIDEFIKYLNSLSFLFFINVIEKNLRGEILILENQNNEISISFNTKSIFFKDKEIKIELTELEQKNRKDRIYNATTLCHWDLDKKNLLPEDLFPIINNTQKDLQLIFQKTSLLYTSMFIFDYASLKEDSLTYKLNGYKTFGGKITTSKIKDINIDYNSYNLLYNIYQWTYSGGNIYDKISIARNIISLNFDPKSLHISETTHESIYSNFKIYEHQNVKQYIEVRNKLSEILIELQGKIDKIVDGFISDYKKNIITLISFFISVIAIRVVSKGDFVGGFTTDIIILSYSFLLISIGILIYSRWELSQRIIMFDKHYEQLKERYKELLSSEEINKIFEQCNPKNINSKSFILQQKKFYSILWSCSIIALAIALLIIHFINNNDFFLIFHIFKIII